MDVYILFNSSTKLECERVARLLADHLALATKPKKLDKLIRKVRDIADGMYYKLSKSGRIPLLDAGRLSMFLVGLSLEDGVSTMGTLDLAAEKFRDAVVELLRSSKWLCKWPKVQQEVIAAVQALANSKSWAGVR
jgi:hypothetical protein